MCLLFLFLYRWSSNLIRLKKCRLGSQVRLVLTRRFHMLPGKGPLSYSVFGSLRGDECPTKSKFRFLYYFKLTQVSIQFTMSWKIPINMQMLSFLSSIHSMNVVRSSFSKDSPSYRIYIYNTYSTYFIILHRDCQLY